MIGKFKIQNSKFKINQKSKCQITKRRFCHWEFVICAYFVICALSFAINPSYAKEITIIYTGKTHAMLYPCHCPVERDGGIARRATLIGQLKKNNPAVLVLDSGGFFAGGAMDEYTQNTKFDMQRTLVNLKAMELMGYDAAAVGDDEFNFGKEFLEENIAKTKLAFLACNLKSDKLSGYFIKEVGEIKIGIIGVTNPAVKNKAVGLELSEPKLAVKQAIEELKKKGAKIIVLLSHLGESEDLKLIRDTSGIDILITGHSFSKEEPFSQTGSSQTGSSQTGSSQTGSSQTGSTLILRPSWQGRRLGKLTFGFKDSKIINPTVEELRLSDKISDAPKILSILPRCFRDSDCKKKGSEGKCEEPGTLKARCQFKALPTTKVSLLIIAPKECMSCNTEKMVQQLKTALPGLGISYLYYPDIRANKLIRDLGIKGLPVYLFGREIEKEKSFDNLKERLEARGNFYIVKPEFSGISYFVERKKIKGNLDLFLSLYAQESAQLLDALKDFHPIIHFLALEQKDTFEATRGLAEAEEYLRSVCVEKHYPEQFWNYISCRAKNINTSWWEDCLGSLDSYKIKTCAKSEEGKELLRENIRLNKELQIMFGPTYLLDNQEVFGIKGVATKEDFRKILKR